MEERKTFTKHCSLREFEIFRVASSKGIAPPMTKSDPVRHTIAAPWYKTLNEFPQDEWKRFYPQLALQVRKIHRAGYVWLDPSEENIVVNETGVLYLIDFGLSLPKSSLWGKEDAQAAQAFDLEESKWVAGVIPLSQKPSEFVLEKCNGRYKFVSRPV